MKSYNVRIRRAVTVKTAAAAAFALTLAVVMAGTSQAQDASNDGSSWNMFDSVLVLPPVYRSDAKSAPADARAEDCNQDPRESPSAVAGTADDPTNASAGTADNPADESAGADGSTPDGSDWQEQQATASCDPHSAGGLESSFGSAQDYEEQQVEDAAELSNYGIARTPSLVIGVPVGPYFYVPRTFSSAVPVFAPITRVSPRPSIVPHGIPGTVEGFHRGFFRGFRGGGFSGDRFHGDRFHGGGDFHGDGFQGGGFRGDGFHAGGFHGGGFHGGGHH